MPLIYNNKKIIPAPFVSINKEYIRRQDGVDIGVNYIITLRGKLLACKGSPLSDGSFWTTSGYPPDSSSGTDCFQSILSKQNALRNLFADDGCSLEIQPYNGTNPFKCYPRVRSIEFPEGNWYDTCDYTIVLEAPELFGNLIASSNNPDTYYGTDNLPIYLSEVSEGWNIEMQDSVNGLENQYIFRLIHNLSAVGRDVYNADGDQGVGYLQAKRWVQSRLGIDNTILYGTGTLNLPAYGSIYNHTRNEITDETGGSYSVMESWLFSSGNYKDDFNIVVNKDRNSSLYTVSIDGNIEGYEIDDGNLNIIQSKWTSALNRFNVLQNGAPLHTIYNRALQYSYLSYLNPTPLKSNWSYRPHVGIISYSYEYDESPPNYVVGSIYENISIQDVRPTNVFARIPVLGRQAGPVLQDLSTYTERQRTMTVDVVMPPYSGLYPTSIAGFINTLASSPYVAVSTLFNACDGYLRSVYGQVFISNDNDSWDVRTGRYNRTATWVYQACT